MSLASDERAALCAELDRVGPDAPTLCDGWDTRDLLAHMLVRERKPWAAAGIMLPPLAGLTEAAMRSYADAPWPEMVERLRGGAPIWSPYVIPTLDRLANGAEYFVHHEDVRRAQPGWVPRPADPARDARLWALLKRSAGMLYRKSPVGVVLARPDRMRWTGKPGAPAVTVTGEPAELVLHAFGRDATRVAVDGPTDAVAALAGAARGV